MVRSRHHHNVLRLHTGIHSLPDLPAHVRLAQRCLRPVILRPLREAPDIGAEAVCPQMVGFHAARLLHDALPEGVVPVLAALLVKLLINIHPALLALRLLHSALWYREKCL